MKKILMLLTTNKWIRISIALVLAVSVWRHYEGIHIIEKSYKVPCCFYNQENKVITQAPEYLDICVRGTRNSLKLIEQDILAIHIDASALENGKHRLMITAHDLFLPETIKLVNWKPINAFVMVG